MRTKGVWLTLPGGLAADRSARLAGLVAEATGSQAAASDLPWLSPALLFSDPAVQSRMALPAAGPAQALVHDYQAVRYAGPFPVGAPLAAEMRPERDGDTYRFSFALSAQEGGLSAELTTALRLVSAAEIAAAAPLALRTGMTRGLPSGGAALSRSCVDAYLDASGDRNPIHSDAAAARAAGLSAPAVPGLLLISALQPLCAEAMPGAALQELKARFLAPVPVGATLRLYLQDRGADPRTAALRSRVFLSAAPDTASAIVDLTLAPHARG